MNRSNPLFYGKILLFGEYGIIKDSMGLSIPHTYYKGALQFEDTFNEKQASSNKHLFAYLDYLKREDAPCRFNLNQFETDLNKGLYFDSSIPQGFGWNSLTIYLWRLRTHFLKDLIGNPDESSLGGFDFISLRNW